MKYRALALLIATALTGCHTLPLPTTKTPVALEQAAAYVLTDKLDAPWDMQLDDEGFLWVTERLGKQITRVDTKTGQKHAVIAFDDAHTGKQQGVLGLALSPDFAQTGILYTAYTYQDKGQKYAKIVKLGYSPKSQKAHVIATVLDKLPANDDHNAGRMVIGMDGKLYYSIGDMGHNQGNHKDKPIRSQLLPSQTQVDNKDWQLYTGKILRINTDGTIPADNPRLDGVQSHIFTYGHRNPQGLAFVGARLFSVEHGPNTDDELNLLQKGGNYGWPHVAGFVDNQAYEYTNHSQNAKPKQETDWQGVQADPLKTFYTVNRSYEFQDNTCGDTAYVCWPTIAPASVTYYPKDGANRYWQNSLIVSSLKNGALYVLPLKDDQSNIQGDVRRYFHTANRYRHTVVSPDGTKLYVATDVSGPVVGTDGKPTKTLANAGSILVFELKDR